MLHLLLGQPRGPLLLAASFFFILKKTYDPFCSDCHVIPYVPYFGTRPGGFPQRRLPSSPPRSGWARASISFAVRLLTLQRRPFLPKPGLLVPIFSSKSSVFPPRASPDFSFGPFEKGPCMSSLPLIPSPPTVSVCNVIVREFSACFVGGLSYYLIVLPPGGRGF